MTSHAAHLEERLALARKMAIEAGTLALKYFNAREQLIVETKADPQDVVSIADREVEELIRSRIVECFPDDAILGEEYGVSPGTSDYTWVIDPIDGTSPFVNGMPSWCISIAALYGEQIAIGVIYVPCNDELYDSAIGMGARLNDKELKLNGDRTIRNSVTGIGANHHVSPASVAHIVEKLLDAGGNFIRNGSGALMLAYVAAGRLVGYYEPYMHAWDCMAGYCLVKEAGGWHHPFPVKGDGLTKGAPVLAASMGAVNDLREIANL